MSQGIDPAALARFLRQRKELGETDFFLDGVDRDEVLRQVSRAAAGLSARSTAAPAHPAPSDSSTTPSPAPGRTAGRPAPSAPPAGAVRPPTEAPTAEALPVVEGPSNEALAELDYDALKAAAEACTRCRLAPDRRNVVFSDGNPDARLMVVGEAPGANEDATGLPFVGQAGKFLDLLLASIDLSRTDSVYIANVLKCRPPGNRNPMPDEIELCSPYLKRQIALVKPEALLAVGTFAGQLLTGQNRPLGKLRGEVYSYEGVPLVVTYHPAALLRNGGWTRSTWDDLQLLRQVMDGHQ